MRRSGSGYSGYRGRRTWNERLKLTAAALAVLVVLVLVGLVAGQKYIVFTDHGLRLDLPFSEEQPPVTESPGSVSVVVRPSDGQEEDNVPEEQPAEAPAMLAVELPVESVLDGTAQERMEELGGSALVLEMKSKEGKLTWSSGQSLANQAGINGPSEVNEALRQWNQGEVYTIARICCFQDNTLPYQRNDLALRATYGNWRDELGLRWLNPDSGGARAYLAALCGELAELGFDEIVLEQCAFPARGNLESVVQSGSFLSGAYAAAVEELLKAAVQAVEPYGAVLSVRCGLAAITGEEGNGGLTPALLNQYAGRVWTQWEEGSLADVAGKLQMAGLTGGEDRLVRVVSALDMEGQGDRACLSEQ